MNMKLFTSLLCLLVVFHCSYAPPVHPDSDKDNDSEIKEELKGTVHLNGTEYNPEDIMEYHRYLQEVVQALESDPDFRERLEKANEDDVRSGKIAEQLDFVNHNVRTKLDEIKRRELERLRHLATRQYEINNNLDVHGKVSTNEHLDHANPHTFEIEDLKKLILKTTKDLEAADQQRKREFKEYEMQKEFEKQQKIEHLDEQQKKEFEEKLKQEEEAKKHHKPLHHPVKRDHLLETWKNSDKMEPKDFDPKVFFMLHDVDGNGVWDANEVKALFIKELDKLYGPGGPNKDMHERAEEMERMREHVFQENDKNRDGLIDFQEFMLEAKKSSFNQDEGWKSIDENEIYTKDEYQQFEKERLEEIKYLQQRGLLDANGHPIPGAEHQINQAIHEKRMFDHQQKLQQQYYQQRHPGQHPPGQVPQYQQVPQVYQGQQQYQQHPGQFQAPHQGQFQGQQGQFQPPPQQYPGQGQQQQQQYQGQQQQYQGQQPQQHHYQGQQASHQQYQGQPPQQQQYQGQPQQQQQYQGQQQQQQYQGQQQQFQQPPQGQAAPKTGQNLNQLPPVNAQPSQGQDQAKPPQGQPPQGQPPQGQPPQGQLPQGQPPQGQPPQGQPDQASLRQQTSNQPQAQKPPA
ncbi:nucleobindin-2 isoform X3 [Hyposmocoma kahamanoa]|uniref:nucleobindin-2 isoform X3 n=1 Tax=Hyposmocoma kahamanoa TaxID=1477025 RepID=UPI000E6D9C54|nr:nucleobindin-2 isoform X3 [Hyposmocoma kahamanoa]